VISREGANAGVVSCTQPLEAVKYRDHRMRTTYLPGSGTDTVSETGSRAITALGVR
jgi:hypothetical protein